MGVLAKKEPRQEIDNAWKGDELDRQKVAEFFTPIIGSIRQPFVISLNSPYGTGKTFFIQHWKKQLEDDGYLSDALERYEDVCLFDGSAADYAYDLINETCEVPDYLSNYIDYDAIARDMEINGEITAINRELIVTNANEF